MEVVCIKKVFVYRFFIFMYLPWVNSVLESHTTLATLVHRAETSIEWRGCKLDFFFLNFFLQPLHSIDPWLCSVPMGWDLMIYQIVHQIQIIPDVVKYQIKDFETKSTVGSIINKDK